MGGSKDSSHNHRVVNDVKLTWAHDAIRKGEGGVVFEVDREGGRRIPGGYEEGRGDAGPLHGCRQTTEFDSDCMRRQSTVAEAAVCDHHFAVAGVLGGGGGVRVWGQEGEAEGRQRVEETVHPSAWSNEARGEDPEANLRASS